MKQARTINIVVMNTQELEAGIKPVCEFNQKGGVIGSDSSVQWSLKVPFKEQSVQPYHCEILVFDEHFCVKDLCGDTYINGATMPLGKNRMAQVDHKDTIKVGSFDLVVLNESSSEKVSLQSQNLEQLFSENSDLLNNDNEAIEEHKTVNDDVDPLDLLGSNPDEKTNVNNLLAYDQNIKVLEESQEDLLNEPLGIINNESTLQADSEFEISSAIKLKKRRNFNPFSYFSKSEKLSDLNVQNEQLDELEEKQSTVSHYKVRVPNKEENTMDDYTLDLLEEEMAMNNTASDNAIIQDEHNHILSGPLFKGLGVKVTDHHNTMDIQMMSEEIGAALQAAIKGILELHQHVNKGRYGVINKNLQPIEDNPLRLGLPYNETVRTMFKTDVGNVHLSAPASISESLNNLKNHNDVVQVATTLALGQILKAFSPDTLMRRFENYRRSYEVPEQNKGEWAWEMYQSYYRELTSERQQGFEKLFWEIFDQSYDRLLREKQSEA